MGNGGVVGDESMVKVGKAEEGLYILDFCWGWPDGNSIKFDMAHGKLTRFDDHPEILNLRDIELTLF